MASASGSPETRSRISPAMTKPVFEYTASLVRGPGLGDAATKRRARSPRGWRTIASKRSSVGSAAPEVWPSRSRTVACRSPRHAGYQRRMGSSSANSSRSASRSASAAVAILVTLSNAIAVRVVIGRRGSMTASPAAPDQAWSSGKTTVTESPGTPVLASCSPSNRSNSRAISGVSRACSVLSPGAGEPRAALSRLSPQPAPSSAAHTRPATARWPTDRHYASPDRRAANVPSSASVSPV